MHAMNDKHIPRLEENSSQKLDEEQREKLKETQGHFLFSQVKVLRDELKNIRQEQRKQQQKVSQNMTLIQSLLKNPAIDKLQASNPGPSGQLTDDGCYLRPVAFIRSCFKKKNGTPRQSSICKSSRASLTLDKKLFTNPSHPLFGLDQFSHLWLIFVFHQNAASSGHKSKVCPPRMNGESIGIFATRSPHRPCPIGLSLTRLDRIEDDTIFLSEVDLVDGTPVLDIKPFIPSYDSPHLCANSTEAIGYTCNTKAQENGVKVADWVIAPKTLTLKVRFTESAERQVTLFHKQHDEPCSHCLDLLVSAEELKRNIIDILQEDPRSTYRRNEKTDRLYYFTIDVAHVTCWFSELEHFVEVLRVNLIKDSILGDAI